MKSHHELAIPVQLFAQLYLAWCQQWGPFAQDLKNSLKPEVRDPHAAVDASPGHIIYHKGSSQVKELFPQPAAEDSH